MVENYKVESFRLHIDKVNWLNNQSKLTGKPKTQFVDQGLDLMMGAAKISRIKTVAIPLVYFYAGVLIILFSILFLFVIHIFISVLMVSLGVFTMVIALYATAQGVKLWRATNGR